MSDSSKNDNNRLHSHRLQTEPTNYIFLDDIQLNLFIPLVFIFIYSCVNKGGEEEAERSDVAGKNNFKKKNF